MEYLLERLRPAQRALELANLDRKDSRVRARFADSLTASEQRSDAKPAQT